MEKKLKIYTCIHCKTKFVLLRTQNFNRVVPVEITDKNNLPEENEIYHRNNHTSHLRKCEARAADWEVVMQKLMKGM